MAVDAPDDLAVKGQVGKTFLITDPTTKERRPVTVEAIRANLTHPTKFEIDAKGETYLISMLDFYAQVNGEKITQEEIELFDQTTFEVDPWRKKKGLLTRG